MNAVLMKRVAGFGRGVFALKFLRPTRARRLRARTAHAYRAYEIASRDPEFIARLAEVDRDFDPAIADGLRD